MARYFSCPLKFRYKSISPIAIMKGHWMEYSEGGWVTRAVHYRGVIYITDFRPEFQHG